MSTQKGHAASKMTAWLNLKKADGLFLWLGLAQTEDGIALFPLTTLAEEFNALKALQHTALCAEC